jgi:methionyl aminopeptidase
MVICVEPMLMTGSNKYFVDKKNNWTVYAKNHKQTCHWEYQVWIKDDGYEILTK